MIFARRRTYHQCHISFAKHVSLAGNLSTSKRCFSTSPEIAMFHRKIKIPHCSRAKRQNFSLWDASICTLWKTNITMENHHFLMGKSTINDIFYSYVSLPKGRSSVSLLVESIRSSSKIAPQLMAATRSLSALAACADGPLEMVIWCDMRSKP